MERIPCYERGDGGSIPSGGANDGVASVVVCTAVCETVRQGSIPGFTPRMIISVVEYLRDMEKVASSNLASSTKQFTPL